jgi:diguanylate cyclase (GGDEF)-like protein
VNDTFGHLAGDEVLRQAAARIRACVREVDTVARLGGDEFVVLIEDIDAPDAPRAIAEKLIASLRDEIDIGTMRLRVTTSIGIAQGVPFGSGHDELMRQADKALYEAKAAGRNTWRIAPAESPPSDADPTSLESPRNA